MSKSSFSFPLDRAFKHWLDEVGCKDSQDTDVFLAAQPKDLQGDLRRMIEDYLSLQKTLGSRSGELYEGRVLGGFRLIHELGRGGMGAVWEAEQVSLKSNVALKILNPQFSFSPTTLQRFQREAEAGGRLQHVGVVKTFAVGETDGVHWIAQELIPGGLTFADFLAEQRQQSELPTDWYRQTADRFALIADALGAAHEAGVVHRDIKPQNILLGDQNLPKVADFGLAQIQDDLNLSRTGEFLGTPFYMSPEQAMSKRLELDHRTDIFSLGATLYEALTLVRAFDGDTSQQVFQKIITEEPPDPQKLRSRVPRDLAVICAKCIEKNPEQRYESMADLAADLRRHLKHEPILAKPPSALARAAKWCHRHPVVSVAGGVAGVALITISSLAYRLAAERDLTEEARGVAEIQTEHARREAATSQRVVDLLVDVFEINDPGEARGNTVTARELLDHGAEWIAAGLTQEPEIRARLMHVIGDVYYSLGLYDAAEPLLRSSAKEWSRIRGPENVHALAAFASLGTVFQKQGKLEQAESLIRNLLLSARNSLGTDHKETIRLLNIHGTLLDKLGHPSDAEALFKEALEAGRRTSGILHPETLAPLNNLGILYHKQGKFDEAESFYKKALGFSRINEETLHPDALMTLNNLGVLLTDKGLYSQAEPFLVKTVEVSRLVNGPDHPTTLTYLNNLGMVLWRQNKVAEAEPLLLESLEGCRKQFGPDHPDVLVSLTNVGWLLEEQGKLDEAEEFLLKALEGSRRQFGPEHADTISSMNNYGMLLRAQGELEGAETMMREVVTKSRRIHGVDHPATLISIDNLGLILEELGELNEAEALVREALYASRHVNGTDHPDTVISLQNLSRILLALDRPLDALPLARELVESTPLDHLDRDERVALLAEIEGRL